jgi:16S rRNA (guanine527-N7)-methyltransferase
MSKDFSHYQDILSRHLRFVLDYNIKVNLTSIESFDAGILLHIEDSLTALTELNKAPEGKLADIGSGGGFPGIPLAIASGRDTLLIESIKKKAAALQEFIDIEKLNTQIKVASLRSEEVATIYPQEFAAVTARAVSDLSVLIELASPLLQINGLLIALKGSPDNQELNRASLAADIAGMQFNTQRELVLSDNKSKRTIITYKKITDPKITLPRRPGMATKRPIA